MTLKQWEHHIKKIGELRGRFDKAAKAIKDDGLNTFPVNVDVEECFILCEILATTALTYNRGDFEYKGEKEV
jgi:hypothetical protein